MLSKGHVRCPWHGACFNISTGDIEDFPGLDSLPTFQVTVPAGAFSEHTPNWVVSLNCFNKCSHQSCLFVSGQSWKRQGYHSCKQAGKIYIYIEHIYVFFKRVHLVRISCPFYSSRLFSPRKDLNLWPDVQLSSTPAQASVTFSLLAQVGAFLHFSSLKKKNHRSLISHNFLIIMTFWWLFCCQVLQVWCAQRRWGKRASLIALWCAPWTDILRMTGLNWVRFVHRPRLNPLRQSYCSQQPYVNDCRGEKLTAAKQNKMLQKTFKLIQFKTKMFTTACRKFLLCLKSLCECWVLKK